MNMEQMQVVNVQMQDLYKVLVEQLPMSIKSTYSSIGKMVSITLYYILDKPEMMLVKEMGTAHSLYEKAETQYKEGCKTYQVETIIKSNNHFNRKFISFLNSSTPEVLFTNQNSKNELKRFPVEKSLELIAIVKYFIQNYESIVYWYINIEGAEKIFKSSNFKSSDFIELSEQLEVLKVNFLLIKEGKLEKFREKVTNKLVKKGDNTMNHNALEFIHIESLIDKIRQGLYYQVQNQIEEDEMEIFEREYTTSVCLYEHGIFVANLTSESGFYNSLIFIIRHDMTIDLWTTDYGLSLVGKNNKQQLIYWFENNLVEYGELSMDENSDFTSYKEITAFLNSL